MASGSCVPQAGRAGLPHEGSADQSTGRLLPQVDPKPFYEACVHDSCSCDTGGDCECFCSAVASYAQECTKEGACVFWRTPDLCRECPPVPPGACSGWAGVATGGALLHPRDVFVVSCTLPPA